MRGLIRTYQLVQMFKDLTVAENVEVGVHRVTRGGIVAASVAAALAARAGDARLARKTRELLDFVGLARAGRR